MPLYLLIPSAAAVVYTLSSLLFKRGYGEGAGTMQTFHWANLIGMPVFLPLFFVHPQAIAAADWWRPAVTSVLIYLGSLGTFAAIRRGDVSLITPILGTKVVFVALAFVWMSGNGLSAGLWLASILAAVGIMVVGRADLRPGSASGPAILFGIASSLFFGLTDVMIGEWAPRYGGTTFLASIPQFLGVFSLVAVARSKFRGLRLTKVSRKWVGLGSVLLAAQGMAMGISLAFFHDPTGVNILYSTRGLWSILLVWLPFRWIAGSERMNAGPGTMRWRLAGTLIITAGVVIAVIERSR